GSRVDRQVAIVPVVLTGEHAVELERGNRLFDRVQRSIRLLRSGRVVLLGGERSEDVSVLELSLGFLHGQQRQLKAGFFFEQFLGPNIVIPEVGLRRFSLDQRGPGPLGIEVKDARGVPTSARAGRQCVQFGRRASKASWSVETVEG